MDTSNKTSAPSNERLYRLPIIDSIVRDEADEGYLIGFVPSDDLSSNEKERIAVRRPSVEFLMVDTLYRRIEQLISQGLKIDRIVHQGGADFAFVMSDGTSFEMADHQPTEMTIEASDRLKQIADVAESTYRLQRRAWHPRTPPPTTKAG